MCFNLLLQGWQFENAKCFANNNFNITTNIIEPVLQ